jgi:hypothetical protein
VSEPQHREWRFYIDDMIDFADRVLAYTDGMDQATFVASALTYDATLRNLELIGEAASRIPAAVREELAQVPCACSPPHAIASFTPISASTMTSSGASSATTSHPCWCSCAPSETHSLTN